MSDTTMKPDQERVKTLLTDTVTLLCKNGLQYNKELKVQGLLGITLDNDDVFVVHINEIFDGLIGGQVVGISSGNNSTSAIAAADSATSEKDFKKSHSHKKSSPSQSPHRSGKRKSSHHQTSHTPLVKIKKESVDEDDDLVVVESKDQFHRRGDGDREAMRLSYGGNLMERGDRRVGDSSNTSESFSEIQSDHGNRPPFITGMIKNVKEKIETEILSDPSSLDNSQLADLGDEVFDGTPGCSQWDSSQDQSGLDQMGDGGGTQDSLAMHQQQQPPPLHPHEDDPADFFPTDIDHMSPRASWKLVGRQGRRSSQNPNKPFACDYPGCRLTFYRRSELNRHQRRKHPDVYNDLPQMVTSGNTPVTVATSASVSENPSVFVIQNQPTEEGFVHDSEVFLEHGVDSVPGKASEADIVPFIVEDS